MRFPSYILKLESLLSVMAINGSLPSGFRSGSDGKYWSCYFSNMIAKGLENHLTDISINSVSVFEAYGKGNWVDGPWWDHIENKVIPLLEEHNLQEKRKAEDDRRKYERERQDEELRKLRAWRP